MKHQFIKISAVDVLEGCSLRVHFHDGAVREINLGPVLYGELYDQVINLSPQNQPLNVPLVYSSQLMKSR